MNHKWFENWFLYTDCISDRKHIDGFFQMHFENMHFANLDSTLIARGIFNFFEKLPGIFWISNKTIITHVTCPNLNDQKFFSTQISIAPIRIFFTLEWRKYFWVF